MAPWFRLIVASKFGSLEGHLSIQLPTAGAKSIVETVEVMPLFTLARDSTLYSPLNRQTS